MPLTIGETFAGYRILRLLGSGGMGEVYLARHPRLPREDALKVLRPDVSEDSSFRERFIREADLAAGLRHPHIVGVHDRGEHDGQLWIAMDYIDGTDTAQLVKQRYPTGMPVDGVVRIVTAIASALDHARKKGLLHRDVKPANIIVGELNTDDPGVFLADFGIARPLDDPGGLTTTNMTVGTVAYAAPEQLMGEPLTGNADQYALAATAYHLLTGVQLFPNTNPAVVISRHLSTTPPRVSDRRPDLARLDSVLQLALAKAPGDRYQSCSAFARALGEASSSDPATSANAVTQAAPQPSRPARAAEPLPNESPVNVSRRTFGPLAGAATILLIVIIALAWRLWDTHLSNSASTSELMTASLTVPPASSAAPSSSPPPPPAPLFSPDHIDQVLLTDEQLSRLVGSRVTDNPAGGGAGGLALVSSSYGTADHSGQVTPRACVGVVFTGEHDVYAAADVRQIKAQTFGDLYGGSPGEAHLLQQTAAVFRTTDQAKAFVSNAEAQWKTCARSDVEATFGFENGATYALGNVQRSGETMTVAMAANSGLRGPDACQQAMGIKDNVVVEARTCGVPNVVSTYDSANGWPRDPGWATPTAEHVVNAMLQNVGA